MSPGGIWSDIFFSETTSISVNKRPQMFCTPPRFIDIYPLKTKGEADHYLNKFINNSEITQLFRTYKKSKSVMGNVGE